jgi:molybdopterin converting factor subunit 1
MILRVRLFARARDLGGTETLSVELPPGSTVGELRRRLAVVAPSLASLLPRCAVAVNNEFAEAALKLSAADEIAVLPPVSGGGR